MGLNGLVLEKASHVTDRYRERVEACVVAMRTPTLHHVAHYTNGCFDLSLDRLAEVRPDRPAEVRSEEGARSLRGRLRQAGRGLADLHNTLHDETAGARQGSLIRTVFQTDRGGLFCNRIVPGEVVVGFHLGPQEPPGPGLRLTRRPGLTEADQAIAGLATGIRRLLSLGGQDPGGFDSQPGDDEVLPGRPEPEGEAADPWARALASAVRPQDLHYAVRVRRGVAEPVEGTELDSPLLARFHINVDPGARRTFYRQLAEDLPELIQVINNVTSRVLGAPLRRVVLDTEQGAFFVYPLTPEIFLLGSTVNQSQVAAADERMAHLARHAAALPEDAGTVGQPADDHPAGGRDAS